MTSLKARKIEYFTNFWLLEANMRKKVIIEECVLMSTYR